MDARLQKILSEWGIASRRQAEKMIEQGRVQVNGEIAQMGQKADPQRDRIQVDGIPINPGDRPSPLYLLLNKPTGVVSTCADPQGRTTVLDLLPADLRQEKGLHPVGRLDFDSTGALLLTNDGELTFQLTHPRHSIPKTYHVTVAGEPRESTLEAWRRGVVLDGKKTRPASVRILDRRDPAQTQLEVILCEGRNRQIRRVAELLGYPVIHLHRTAIGSIHLNPPGEAPLPHGYYRPLNPSEICFLQSQVSLNSVNLPADTQEPAL
ncbi:pseudouridine synthase [Laspinema olomoucense]|uniref:Pseudouridine synthase n=1 Tax=Laspinema olomoucense D3b TaxID=2953688 RepID=A0ABT2NGU4_9CYAN|nr:MULTISPECIES: pseudouridine synthase [unclassified Laspinema]MCT7974650.1 rRNA pseudouridine synthase [Laspinema sp. D3d]MCT7980555.1 rRNA pseudouridine synthase [Laspinema sp. D3b]MCT7989248.1 rRNA pseudouridine synthase [Laspinema sp. D3a]MCT7992621.1 rRNA pseudouridine synthase [Laspinema sp. D3c]